MSIRAGDNQLFENIRVYNRYKGWLNADKGIRDEKKQKSLSRFNTAILRCQHVLRQRGYTIA